MKHLAVAAGILAGIIAACDPMPVDSTHARPDACTGFDQKDDIHVHMSSPRGEETFRVGDTIKVNICSEDPEIYVLVDVAYAISLDAGKRWISIYPERSSDGSRASWAIPESIVDVDPNTLEDITVSTITDNCLIRANRYNSPEDFEIVGPMRIVAK